MNFLTIINFIVKSNIAKTIFGLSLSFETVALFIQSSVAGETFFDALSKNIPAQVLYILSAIYGILRIVDFGARKFFHLKKIWQLDRIEIAKAQEDLERSEIQTQQKRNELEG